MRVVVDTNIIVRALIKPQGTVGPVLRRLRDREYSVLYSEPLLTEIAHVLNRPRIRTKYHVDDRAIQATLALLLLRGEFVVPAERITVCRDPKDNTILEAAVAGHADAIVTADEDLLVLNPFAGISVLTPAVFLTRLGDSESV